MNCEHKIKGVTFKQPPHSMIEETADNEENIPKADEKIFTFRFLKIYVDKYEKNLKKRFKTIKKRNSVTTNVHNS